MSTPKKILMIIVDQLRADCIHGMLSGHVDLPHIRALGANGMTFINHYSVTNPCGPSRASIFTGQYAMNHRSIRNGTPLSDNITNLAREVRKSGFDPLLFGYTDTTIDPRTVHPNDPQLHSEERVLPGMREVLEMRYLESYPWRAYLKSRGYDVPRYENFYDPISPEANRAARPDDPPFFKAQDSDTAFLADTLIRELSVRTEENWFALATFLRPHPPLVAPEPYNKMYDPDKLPLPPRLKTPEDEAEVHPFMEGAIKGKTIGSNVQQCGDRLSSNSDGDVQLLRAIYMGLASEVDTHIGRIVGFLKDTGQYDDTLIVFMADHGEMLGDHHMWGKQNPYDPAYKVPLIICDPANAKFHGTIVEAFTESVDITPTILDLLGRHVPAGMDGVSLKPFLEGRTPEDWRDCVHMELDFGEPNQITPWQKATGASMEEANLAILREERFKLVHFNAGLPPLLFDLKNDPNELKNLAGDPAHAPTVLRLTQKLLSHRMKHADRTLADVRVTPNGAVNFVE
ncbi:MAG TPA: DUF4976 domain-containing protein [Devosia sp.]|nr:DUF4976 domain-containing protein [Devosia sp.]